MRWPNTLAKPEQVVFRGVVYRRMGGRRRYYLSQSSSNAGRQSAKGLHVAVWEVYNKAAVPAGWVVHHIDGDSFNNAPANLECLTRAEHLRLHKVRGGWSRADGMTHQKHLDKVRPLASAWHKSAEGRAWHREHASGPKPKSRAVACLGCGQAFLAARIDARVCSSRCQMRITPMKGPRRELRCAICGASFVTEKYYRPDQRLPESCSRACRGELRSRRSKAAKLSKNGLD